jgi:heavy metal translocating P-type ATPase
MNPLEPPPENACSYCGLPLSGDAVRLPRTERYCCLGCRFAASVARENGEAGEPRWALVRLGFAIFFALNVMVFTMALWAQDVPGALNDSQGFVTTLRGLFRYLCLLFALPVLGLLGPGLAQSVWRGNSRGASAADALLLLGVIASYVFSLISVVRDEGPVYFEVGCTVLVLVTIGRWLEAVGRFKASRALAGLQKLLPEEVRVQDGDGECTKPLASIRGGDRLRVVAGERIPCDGEVESGRALVDQQVLTGESEPVECGPGTRVLGGSLNLDGSLVVRVSAPVTEGAFGRLLAATRIAFETRGRHQRLAERVSRWFLPAVLVVALSAFAWHMNATSVAAGVHAGLAVLLIACPCALGIATPLAVWTAFGVAARRQVLFQSGEALERLASVRAMRFDKTGTLTTGKPVVAEFLAADSEDSDTTLARAYRLAQASAHGQSKAIQEFAGARLGGDELLLVCDTCQEHPGRGVVGQFSDGETVALGSTRFMQELGYTLPAPLNLKLDESQCSGLSLCCVGIHGVVAGLFTFREELRPEAVQALHELQTLGLDVAVLTGDHAARGEQLGCTLGVPVRAELLPEEKVHEIVEAEKKFGPVALVGDGINDAPGLARSSVGIAMGCGADVARAAAQVCLLSNDLRRLPWAVRLGRRTVRVIRQNLFWALVYNVAGIGLACVGLLNPILAAFAMVASSLFVVTNSLRLMRDPETMNGEAEHLPATALQTSAKVSKEFAA